MGEKSGSKNIWKPEFISFPIEADPSRSAEVPTIKDRNADDGWLMYQVPMKKLVLNLNDDFHRLMNFPYDSLRIDGFVCLSGELRLENAKDIVLQLENKNKHGQEQNIMMGASRERSEFILEGLSYGLATHSSPNIKDQVYHDVVFSFPSNQGPHILLLESASADNCNRVSFYVDVYLRSRRLRGQNGDRDGNVFDIFCNSMDCHGEATTNSIFAQC